MKSPRKNGPAIVLTADETLMSNFKRHIHYGFASCFPTSFLGDSVLKRFCPPVRSYHDGRAKLAPLSLRVVESILYSSGFREHDFATLHPKYLDKVIGPKTRVIGISTIDPLGMGPLSRTLCSFYGGEPHTRNSFHKLMKKIKTLRKKHNVKVIAGGAGAWQLSSEKMLDKYGIDHLVIGEAENVIPWLFKELVECDATCLPRMVRGEPASAADIPPILNGTTNGVIEASRGCGRGCTWCFSSTTGKMRCLPINTIKQSAEANIRSGMANIILQSDDILLYGSKSKNFTPDRDAVLTLLKELYITRGIKSISFIHFSVASVAADPELIASISNLMRSRGWKRFDVQIGVETGSSRIIEKHMRGKAFPFTPDEWPTIVKKAAQTLKDNGWFCYATLILGLPGETPDDITQTVELIKDLRKARMAIIPLFYTSIATTQLGEYACQPSKEILNAHRVLLREVRRHNERVASRHREYSHILNFLLFKQLDD